MSPRTPSDHPTEAELAILQVLWDRGPSTVRQVYEALAPRRGTGYTTVLKLMQIMVRKGLVARDESQRSHVYSTARSRRETRSGLVERLLERAFEGSAAQLVEHALRSHETTPEELAKVRRLLDSLERERRR